MDVEPELIVDESCQIGENPLWHPLERRLYWTDIPSGRLYRYDPAGGGYEVCYAGEMVGGFTIQADGGLLLFMRRGAIAKWREGRLETVVEAIPAELEGRFNDVIADPAGRVFCGTVSLPVAERPGRLYRLDTDGSLHLLLDGIGISNGLGFTPDQKQLYYTDSQRRCIYLFDYAAQSGALSRQRVWQQLPAGAGVPDGLTVDAQGYVWSARWGDGALYRYTPEGAVERRIAFPASYVASLTFGGDGLEDIYITTALDARTRIEVGTGAGALFRLRTGARGVAEFFSRVSI
jgi:D-xylonolactonase